MSSPRILFIDIETKPLLLWGWDLRDQNFSLEQIEEDWCILSIAAKWSDCTEVMQWDLRNGINDTNEKRAIKKAWLLFDEADIVIGQNSKAFDVKKLNDKFLKYGLGKPSDYRQEDTYMMSKQHFSPTSHKLEYRSKNLNKKYKKMSHSKYPGLSLWLECIRGNQDAWKEMALYNTFDVLATEEYYEILKPWASKINLNVFDDEEVFRCDCGSTNLRNKGYNYSNVAQFRRYKCNDCGKPITSKINLLTKNKKQSLKGKENG